MKRLPRPTGISATVENVNVWVRSKFAVPRFTFGIDEEVVAVVVDGVLQRVLREQRVAPPNRLVAFVCSEL